MIDIRKIKKLIEMLEASGLAELEIHEGEDSVRLSRYPEHSPQPMNYVPMPPTTYAAAPPAAATPAQAEEASPPDHSDKVITSPMVGTFYRASSPTSKPFVEEGARVQEGDTLCIIEAMKILNQIVADRSGVVSRILVENGTPVEYGQPLFMIE